jgi:hypothetical protein
MDASTLDAAVSEVFPVLVRVESVTCTFASDVDTKRSLESLGDVGVTDVVADRLIVPALTFAPVTVTDELVAHATVMPLKEVPVSVFAAWRVIEPPVAVTTAPVLTEIFSALTRKATPGSNRVPAIVTSSSPSPPSIVSVEVGTGNEMLSIVGADAIKLPVLPSF